VDKLGTTYFIEKLFKPNKIATTAGNYCKYCRKTGHVKQYAYQLLFVSKPKLTSSLSILGEREKEVQDDTDQNYGFIDEFLKEALNTSNIYEAQQDTDYDFWISNHNVHTSISINNTLYKKCMNPARKSHHSSTLDCGVFF
jgi:hypothetical protein